MIFKRIKIPVLIIIGLLLTYCSKLPPFMQSVEKKLVIYNWKLSAAVDSSTNEEVDFPEILLIFNSDGNVEIEKSDGTRFISQWNTLQDDKYLQIGNNIYKINSLTHKILSLRYGTIDIYYLPVDK